MERENNWTYTDENGTLWNYVSVSGETEVTTVQETEWETEVHSWHLFSFPMITTEKEVHHGLREVTKTVPWTYEAWVPDRGETITMVASKEQEGFGSKLLSWTATAFTTWLEWEGPKELQMLYHGWQFYNDARDNGLRQAVRNKVEGMAIDKGLDVALSIGKKAIRKHGTGGKHGGGVSTKSYRYVTQALTTEEKDKLRAEARELAASRLGRSLPYGTDVHHRVPLEFAHLQPHLDPNRLSNLILITDPGARNASAQSFHGRVHDLWMKHLGQFKAKGITPTASDVENIASQIDRYIGRSTKEWKVQRLK